MTTDTPRKAHEAEDREGKLEAEVERLRRQLKRVVEIAEGIDAWGHNYKIPTFSELKEYEELREELAALKEEIK